MILANQTFSIGRRDTEEEEIASFRQKMPAEMQQTTAETKMNQHTGSNEDITPEKLHLNFSLKQQLLLEEIEQIKEDLLT